MRGCKWLTGDERLLFLYCCAAFEEVRELVSEGDGREEIVGQILFAVEKLFTLYLLYIGAQR